MALTTGPYNNVPADPVTSQRAKERKALAASLLSDLKADETLQIRVEAACVDWGLRATEAELVCKELFALDERLDYTSHPSDHNHEVGYPDEELSDG